MHRMMVRVFRRFFNRHMNALRVAHWGVPDRLSGGPVIVYSNHPAWWDAVVYILAADHFLPDHESYAPIDAAMLRRYGIFGRIGAFGVDLDTRRGAADVLAAGAAILSRPDRSLWITAQGRFSDVRERPLGLKPGIAHLVALAPDCTVIPLAIEYGFWLERGAEACLAFGAPMHGRDLLRLDRRARLLHLEDRLEETLERLGSDVAARDPARFKTVLEGRSGIGGVYDAWRRMTSAWRGRRFDPSHEGPVP